MKKAGGWFKSVVSKGISTGKGYFTKPSNPD